jgi:hypothetical protein
MLAALGALEQSGHRCRVAAHAINFFVVQHSTLRGVREGSTSHGWL